MRVLWVLVILCGVWFIASAMTEEGLLPSGHGVGRVPELVLGLAAVGYGTFRLVRGGRKGRET